MFQRFFSRRVLSGLFNDEYMWTRRQHFRLWMSSQMKGFKVLASRQATRQEFGGIH